MGTGKADQTNNNNAEVDNHPEGTRLGHYVLGMYFLWLLIFTFYISILLSKFLIVFLQCIGKALGKGTFGKVKLANHTLTKEKVSFCPNFYSNLVNFISLMISFVNFNNS